ncbi:ParB/RepB/Spo0J family partition protein (plasmid) [Xanthomonas hortorum pv. hederae]|uniref:ParB/RepB/Spo0J family partition protein n=1 Tax=Xanthomonas hortorum TaxID=56454 RepID=UPI0032E891E7
MIDLSALEAKPTNESQPTAEPDGRPFRVKVAEIERDPNQPRKEFPDAEIAELGDNIRERGVKQPISVKTHPTKPGKYQINDGELRWLATQYAKIDDIPVVVDEDFDDFDQVNANEKRFALRPMELAIFIKRKLSEGVKKGVIADRLGKKNTAITELLSLVDAPACVADAYSSGRCTSPKTLYELRGLAEKFPEQVQAWYDEGPDITRATVAKLGDALKDKKKPTAAQLGSTVMVDPITNSGTVGSDGSANEKFSHDEKSGGSTATASGESGGNQGDGSGASTDKPKGSGDKGDANANFDNGELTSWPRGKAVSDPDSMKRPLLIVEHDGRAAAVLLNRRPSSAGLLRIRYEDGGGDAEVDAGAVRINRLAEGEK